MKTTIDRHRARLERARKRVEAAGAWFDLHVHGCRACRDARSCDDAWRIRLDLYEAIGRRKEAESVLREARRHG